MNMTWANIGNGEAKDGMPLIPHFRLVSFLAYSFKLKYTYENITKEILSENAK